MPDTIEAPTIVAAAPAVTADTAGARAAGKEISSSQLSHATLMSSKPRPGSASEAMSQRLQSRAKPADGTAPEPPTKPAVTDPKARATVPPETPNPTVEDDGGGAAATETETPTGTAEVPGKTTDPKGKEKTNPWRLVDDYKKRLTATETRLAELEKTNGSPEAVKQVTEQLTKAQERLKQLEDEIKFVDYSKSAEFKAQYQEPYEKAWQSAMSDLRELSVEDQAGNVRPINAEDMLELVNLPLPKARELAVQKFGDFADDVMGHRKEIKNLFDKQATALKEARENGDKHIKQTAAQKELQQKTLTNEITTTWQKENETALKHPKHGVHFTPIEGDDVGNEKLKKGFELVDRAFAENPADPKHTPEERAAIINRHAAVRNRAAAYGRHVYQLEKATAEIAELKKQLAQYEASTPDTAGREAGSTASGTGSVKDGVLARLRAKAK